MTCSKELLCAHVVKFSQYIMEILDLESPSEYSSCRSSDALFSRDVTVFTACVVMSDITNNTSLNHVLNYSVQLPRSISGTKSPTLLNKNSGMNLKLENAILYKQ